MLDESLLEFVGGDDIGLEKKWQWLFKIEDSPIWSITPIFMTKERFNEFMEEYNKASPKHPIVAFGKAKITRRHFLPIKAE